MNKKLSRKKKQIMNRVKSNGTGPLTNQPAPLSASFAELRKRAINAPVLKSKFNEQDLKSISAGKAKEMLSHVTTIEYNNNYYLVIAVLCVLRETYYNWLIEASYLSKATGRYINHKLLPKKQLEDLNKVVDEALGESGDQENLTKRTTRNAFFWECELSPEDYSQLKPEFRALIGLDENEKLTGENNARY